MIVGYLRVSTERQHPANQQDEIRRFAKNRNWEVDVWVTEVVSGKTRERDRKLGTLLRRMKRGDTLVVTEISRLSRTLTDIMSIMGRCLKKQINLYTTKEGYTFEVVFQKVCLGGRLQILQICKYSDSCFQIHTPRRVDLIFVL